MTSPHTRSTTPPSGSAPAPAVARGTFTVRLVPQPADDHADGAALGRMTLDKEFSGDLQATGRGQMLTGMTSVQGSAAYVAIERVTGTLGGRRGSFILQHRGTMVRGTPDLAVSIVPDSGTDELVGLRGTMQIDVSSGGHSYTLEYALTETP